MSLTPRSSSSHLLPRQDLCIDQPPHELRPRHVLEEDEYDHGHQIDRRGDHRGFDQKSLLLLQDRHGVQGCCCCSACVNQRQISHRRKHKSHALARPFGALWRGRGAEFRIPIDNVSIGFVLPDIFEVRRGNRAGTRNARRWERLGRRRCGDQGRERPK
ncbi:hypothetical protein QJS10_CPA03g02385 [Acorus calamus]|uniref:Uncharacterized protein n=1 Tax=Acorus calamus TaxID=4465 RepID=A0AAV9F6Z1_ACOCL|nr:hypothetical protein QJS10_CPA03g02385 [Acorus calamus]